MRRVFQIAIATFSIALVNSCAKSTTFSGNITTPSGGSIITNVTYGSNFNWLGQTEELKLDVYKPTVAGDVATKHPLVVWIHGGGFLTGDKEAAAKFSTLLANKGFVVAPIDYRLGWTKSDTNPCDADTAQAFEAYYRALQDTRAAIRYLVANAATYGIDTNWIFIGGASAGGVTSLSIPYYTPENYMQYFNSATIAKLGPLDSDNNLTNTFRIKGIMAMWGAISSPDVITSQNAVPTIFFHGTDDNVVPFDVGPFYICPNFQVGYGTKPLYEKLTSLGVPAVAHIEPGGGHGVYTEEFRADNSACFLKSLMSKTPEKGYYIGDASSCQ
ncbi:MAG: alpha/beta hydrolase [Panacibacter sp.]